MKVTYLNNGIRYHRRCDCICDINNYIGLIYLSPEGDSLIWLNKKDTFFESVEDLLWEQKELT